MTATSAHPAPETDPFEAPEAAGPLDLLLPHAAAGALGRFRPEFAAVRLATQLARRPKALARQAGQLAAELRKVADGSSAIAPGPRDRRFADPAWQDNPLLKRIVQGYLAGGQAAEALVADAELDWQDSERMKFVMMNLIAAAAPSNNPLISPAGWKAALDTGGLSAVRGVRALISDLTTAPRIPTMVAPDAFVIGRDLAVTPGAVVHRSDLFELIQYQPSTAMVHRFPLLIVPPMINKFYITDLAPGRSLIEFLTGQGFQVFVISWRNPDRRHRDWDLDAYGHAVVDALAAMRGIARVPRASVLGLCAGGIITSMVSAHLSRTGQLGQLASLCLGVTVLDQAHAGMAAALLDEPTAAAAVLASSRRGYLDGRTLAEVFAWLRPDDLVWNYWVNNYLQGRPPPRVRHPVLERRHHPAARRAAPRSHLARPVQRGRPAGSGHDARLPGRSRPGRRGQLRGRGHRRPYRALAVGLPQYAAAGRPGSLRAVHQRAYSLYGQPADEPQGDVPGWAGQPRRAGRVAGHGRDGEGQLVAGLCWLAGRAERRGEEAPGPAGQQAFPAPGARARELRSRPVR